MMSGAPIKECEVEWDPMYNVCATDLADDYVSDYFAQYTFPTYQDTHETCVE